MVSFISAVAEYNKAKGGKYEVPKKGSPGYKKVMTIFERMKKSGK